MSANCDVIVFFPLYGGGGMGLAFLLINFFKVYHFYILKLLFGNCVIHL